MSFAAHQLDESCWGCSPAIGVHCSVNGTALRPDERDRKTVWRRGQVENGKEDGRVLGFDVKMCFLLWVMIKNFEATVLYA